MVNTVFSVPYLSWIFKRMLSSFDKNRFWTVSNWKPVHYDRILKKVFPSQDQVWLKMINIVAETVKNLTAVRRPRFDPWVKKIPGEGEWLLIQYSCLKKSHGQREPEADQQGHKVGEWLTLFLFSSPVVRLPHCRMGRAPAVTAGPLSPTQVWAGDTAPENPPIKNS